MPPGMAGENTAGKERCMAADSSHTRSRANNTAGGCTAHPVKKAEAQISCAGTDFDIDYEHGREHASPRSETRIDERRSGRQCDPDTFPFCILIKPQELLQLLSVYTCFYLHDSTARPPDGRNTDPVGGGRPITAGNMLLHDMLPKRLFCVEKQGHLW